MKVNTLALASLAGRAGLCGFVRVRAGGSDDDDHPRSLGLPVGAEDDQGVVEEWIVGTPLAVRKWVVHLLVGGVDGATPATVGQVGLVPSDAGHKPLSEVVEWCGVVWSDDGVLGSLVWCQVGVVR